MADITINNQDEKEYRYTEIASPSIGANFNASAQREQFLGGGTTTKVTQQREQLAQGPSSPEANRAGQHLQEAVGMQTQAEQRWSSSERGDTSSSGASVLTEQGGVEAKRNADRDLKRGEQLAQPEEEEFTIEKTRHLLRTEQLIRDRQQLIEQYVSLTRDYYQNSGMEGASNDATLENFNDPTKHFVPGGTSEEIARVGNLLSEGAWREFSEAYPDKVELMRQLSDASGQQAYELMNRTDVQEMMRKFEEEHPDAYNISVKIGMQKRDKYGNAVSLDQRWWQKQDAEQEEAKKGKPTSSGEAVQPIDKEQEKSTVKKVTLIDAEGKQYPMSAQGELTQNEVIEAFRSAGAVDLVTRIEQAQQEGIDLQTLLASLQLKIKTDVPEDQVEKDAAIK